MEAIKKCNKCGKPYKYFNVVNKYLPGCNCEYKKAEARRKGTELKNKIKYIKNCGLGLLYQDKTFSNYDRTENEKAYIACLDYAKNLFKYLKEGSGLFLCGDVGTGKTHLAAAIVDYVARMKKGKMISGFYILYTTTADLIADVVNSFSNGITSKQIYDKYKNAILLIIDELGIERQTEFSREAIYQVVNYRYSNKLASIYISNLNIEELSGKIDRRITSRICESCKGIKLTGTDHRIKIKR